MINNPNISTLIGMSAIFMWSTLVGLIRLITDELDALTSLALLYSFSTLILLFIFKIPSFKKIPKTYYVLITFLFVAYELCFSFSVALAKTPLQTIEVGVINHLWPTFTILMMLLSRYLKFNYKLMLGLIFSAIGVMVIQTNGFNLSWNAVLKNLILNPVSYLLALAAALIWAVYCVILIKYKPDNNVIVALFFCTSLSLLIKWLCFSPVAIPSITGSTGLLLLCASACLSLGYAAWNIGMIHGNAHILVSSSYFIPIFSAFFSSLLFRVQLDIYFWIGTGLVVAGSLICWTVTAFPETWKLKIRSLLA